MLLLAIWFPATATAAPSVRIAPVHGGAIGAATLEAYGDDHGVHARLSFEVSAAPASPGELVVPVVLAGGAVITGATVALEEDTTLVAHVAGAGHARERYREAVELRRDPALLEWLATSPAGDREQLRLFPVFPGEPARVVLELELPPAAHVQLAVAGQRVRSIDLPAMTEGARTPHIAVGRGVSLVATERDRDEWASLPWGVLRPHVAAVPQCTSNRDTTSSVASTAIRASSSSTARL